MDLFGILLFILGVVFISILVVQNFRDSKLIVKRDQKMIELLEKIVNLLNEKDR